MSVNFINLLGFFEKNLNMSIYIKKFETPLPSQKLSGYTPALRSKCIKFPIFREMLNILAKRGSSPKSAKNWNSNKNTNISLMWMALCPTYKINLISPKFLNHEPLTTLADLLYHPFLVLFSPLMWVRSMKQKTQNTEEEEKKSEEQRTEDMPFNN